MECCIAHSRKSLYTSYRGDNRGHEASSARRSICHGNPFFIWLTQDLVRNLELGILHEACFVSAARPATPKRWAHLDMGTVDAFWRLLSDGAFGDLMETRFHVPSGPWRWYHESMLDCCTPLEVVRAKGITMDKVSFCSLKSIESCHAAVPLEIASAPS